MSSRPPSDDAAPTERLPVADERYGYVEPPVEEEVIERRPPRRPPTLWP
jgi:hypothetical protein